MYEEMMQCIQQLQRIIHHQEQRIIQCEQQIKELYTSIETIQQKPLVIEKIEYKFDQLKVETLEGTLNIGLNPLNESSDIENFEVNNRTLTIRPNEYTNPNIEEEIQEDILHYLDTDGFQQIQQLEETYHTPLNEYYRNMMLDDIRTQIQPRIPYYFQLMQKQPNLMSNPTLLHQTIVGRMKEDISKAFIAFIEHFPKQM